MQQVMTIQEQVYQFLKEDICSGVFRPGQRLQEVSIANQYKVSRSPVREALRRLAADGLVEEVPNKGVTVKRYSARDMEEIYEMRVMMENEAIDHLTRAKLAPMEEELTSLAGPDEAGLPAAGYAGLYHHGLSAPPDAGPGQRERPAVPTLRPH